MNTFKVLLISVIILISTTAFSQIRYGIKGGLNLCDNTFDIDSEYGEEPETLLKLGFHVGLTFDIPLVQNTLSLQPGLIYTTKGYSVDFEKCLKMEVLT